jgi:hypothetical protein
MMRSISARRGVAVRLALRDAGWRCASLCASLVASGAGRVAAEPRQALSDTVRLVAARTHAARPTDPADFVMAVESGRVELRSPSTGRLVKVVGRWGHQITNGGPVAQP